jgi:outer membrane protein assembly factor BamB
VAGLAAAPALLLTTAAAAPGTRTVPVPVDFQPEGIAVGTGSTFYVGSLHDGDIYRASLRSGQGSVLVDVSGRQALGMKVDEPGHRLFVAGGFDGHAFVYDTRSGATLANFTLAPSGATLVNDVALTRQAAYFTDSFSPHLYRVPLHRDGSFGPPSTLTVTGPAGVPTAAGGFGLNGIDATPDGRTLVVARSDLGALFTVDPRTGSSRAIPLTGGSLTPGTPDGILLAGPRLFIVENFANTLVEVRLAPHLRSGAVVAMVSDPAFEVPTAVARHGHELALVNARFDLGFPPPLGPGAPPGTPFDVVVLGMP